MIAVLFGKDRIYEIIRKNATLGAEEILDTILASLTHFQKGAKLQDDITLVIIKIID